MLLFLQLPGPPHQHLQRARHSTAMLQLCGSLPFTDQHTAQHSSGLCQAHMQLLPPSPMHPGLAAMCAPSCAPQGGTPVKGEAHHAHTSSAPGAPLPIDPALHSTSTGTYSLHGTAAADDTASEVAPSEYGTRVGSRLSMRHEWEGADDGGSQKGTLKGMFKKQKKSKQYELDALRCGSPSAYKCGCVQFLLLGSANCPVA